MKHLERLQRKRRRRKLPPSAVGASAAVHGVVVLIAVVSASAVATPLPPRTYRVHLVAMADERAPERLEPQPPEPAEEEHRPPPPEPTPERVPETEQPTVKEEKPPAEPEKEPAKAPEEGEEEVNIDLEGRSCGELLTQAYCDNITRQVYRYWRRPTGGRNLSAEISFVIREDGSVTDVEWKQRSGDPAFDLEARGAIEAAGKERAFGSLPERYPLDRLRVSFFFDPRRL